jgi:hypothetical protein
MTMSTWTQCKLFGRVHLLSLSQLSNEIMVNQGEFGKEARRNLVSMGHVLQMDGIYVLCY